MTRYLHGERMEDSEYFSALGRIVKRRPGGFTSPAWARKAQKASVASRKRNKAKTKKDKHEAEHSG